MSEKTNIETTKRLMGALVRMKPKPHEAMKISKKRAKVSPKKRAASKPKNV